MIRTNNIAFKTVRRYTSSKPDGILRYAKLTEKSYLKIHGPDTIKFLNGLVTSKLLPNFTKKNLTTVTEKSRAINLPFSLHDSNVGIYNDVGINDEFYISRFGQYTGFLNGRGKLITDSIIYPLFDKAPYPEFYLEFNKNIVHKMHTFLQHHKLLSKFKLNTEKLQTWDVSIGFPTVEEHDENPWVGNILNPMMSIQNPEDALSFINNVKTALFDGYEKNILGIYVERRTDPLIRQNGSMPLSLRLVTDDTIKSISSIYNEKTFPFKFDMKEVEPSFFRKQRLTYGITDGTQDFKSESLLPLELNFDKWHNAVSENKGCYVGQELTARTFSTGILRKRVVPVTLPNFKLLESNNDYFEIQAKNPIQGSDPNLAQSPFGQSKNSRKRPAGALVAHEGDVGLALLRTEYFQTAFGNNNKFYIHLNDTKTVEVHPQKPFWYSE
ncbi:hypothetical protein KAFR_0A03210 [Kazachstania africana CBS 2517]|uniref:CAF17 C-terminal domain-containing protein n=1 Tax=Kazachstania africana (strain ATCC 22294 / BCRC 22015 / CBS 2517 / CECT 1963 / NBRC 1671 / NRRL Y-8276) TaxID=1071382 RepID=H2AN06_KAZAF|nr:hypothetical protein KAFR_0A03210 [Kazachstania africana CBS 2517]CCF55756.1 hypothetical protein KAFR_0A03210 [Kazachstania africana CBS 2517]